MTVAVSIDNMDLDLAHSTATVTFTFSNPPVAFTLANTIAVGGTLSNLRQVNATTYSATFTAAADTDIANASVSVEGSPVTFSSAVATFYEVQNNWAPSQMIDGIFTEPNQGINGWSVFDFAAGMADGADALLTLASPLPGGHYDLNFKLYQNYFGNPGHILGDFALAYTTAASPTLSSAQTRVSIQSESSLNGTTFSLLSPGELLANTSRNSVGTDTYTVSATIDSVSPITGIFLDAIKNPTLPGGGPGGQYFNGNFVVSEFTLEAGASTPLFTVHTTIPPAPPPPGTTADMVLRGANASPTVPGRYEIYNIGNNTILAAYSLRQVGTDWGFVTLGGFNDTDTDDMLLRNSTTGGFQVYNIRDNNVVNSTFIGNIGTEWQVSGFGNFSSFGESDMMMRRSSDGAMVVYDISNNQIIGANSMGAVGLNWQVAGFGNFSSCGTSDMIMRNTNTGGLEVYDINGNQIMGAAFMGTVGLDWAPLAFGDFSSRPGATDMIMRNTNTGAMVIYDINNNQITSAYFIGTVGLDWQFAGVAPVHAAGATDLVLRNANTGAFEVYDIEGNSLVGAGSLGAVGLDWQLGGFAADPQAAPPGGSDGSTSQLIQAMAGFGGSSGAGETMNAAPLGADTSQQPLLTTPQHA
jgi:Bacterial Ig-like domain